ncbi:MAG: MBL fold metallo-hydrolase [Natrialbaceae archaeon]|nr:MBL fold metallo-hydrolase [Natrialbaceae archaeon]
MSDMDFPTADVPVDTLSPTALKDRIDAGEPVTILDTRMQSDYESWQIDGPEVESINIPYFEFLDEKLDQSILSQLPDDQPMTVICAKGGASEYVAGRLIERGYEVTHVAEGMHGWARIYDRVAVERYTGTGTLYQYQRPSSGCLGYLLVADTKAAVIDPLHAFTSRYLEDAESLGASLTYAFDTHIHADHISGVRALAQAGVEGVVPAPAIERGVTDPTAVTHAYDGDEFDVGGATIQARYTPGHTSGMTAYYVDESFLATGDTLFTESVARPDLEAGDAGAADAARQLHESLHDRILGLPEDTLIGGAHASTVADPAADGTYTATIAELRDRMDALGMDEAGFVDLVLADMPPRPANYEEIIATNLGQETVDDEAAFELELGPNNCAASQESLAGD